MEIPFLYQLSADINNTYFFEFLSFFDPILFMDKKIARAPAGRRLFNRHLLRYIT